jgi:predicted pyridoxine 5'-phosphate oxidase superfamily flavin-nucleotide-binding protein
MNQRDITRRSFLRALAAGLLTATGALGIAKPLPAGDAEQGTIAGVIPADDSKMWKKDKDSGDLIATKITKSQMGASSSF